MLLPVVVKNAFPDALALINNKFKMAVEQRNILESSTRAMRCQKRTIPKRMRGGIATLDSNETNVSNVKAEHLTEWQRNARSMRRGYGDLPVVLPKSILDIATNKHLFATFERPRQLTSTGGLLIVNKETYQKQHRDFNHHVLSNIEKDELFHEIDSFAAQFDKGILPLDFAEKMFKDYMKKVQASNARGEAFVVCKHDAPCTMCNADLPMHKHVEVTDSNTRDVTHFIIAYINDQVARSGILEDKGRNPEEALDRLEDAITVKNVAKLAERKVQEARADADTRINQAEAEYQAKLEAAAVSAEKEKGEMRADLEKEADKRFNQARADFEDKLKAVVASAEKEKNKLQDKLNSMRSKLAAYANLNAEQEKYRAIKSQAVQELLDNLIKEDAKLGFRVVFSLIDTEKGTWKVLEHHLDLVKDFLTKLRDRKDSTSNTAEENETISDIIQQKIEATRTPADEHRSRKRPPKTPLQLLEDFRKLLKGRAKLIEVKDEPSDTI